MTLTFIVIADSTALQLLCSQDEKGDFMFSTFNYSSQCERSIW